MQDLSRYLFRLVGVVDDKGGHTGEEKEDGGGGGDTSRKTGGKGGGGAGDKKEDRGGDTDNEMADKSLQYLIATSEQPLSACVSEYLRAVCA